MGSNREIAILNQEAFGRIVGSVNAKNTVWLEGRWKSYCAQVRFISKVYAGEPRVQKELFVAIHPNSLYDTRTEWINNDDLVSVLVEADKQSREIETVTLYSAFNNSNDAVAAYLRTAPEFQNRIADAIFIRFALQAGSRVIDANLQDTRSSAKFLFGFNFVTTAIVFILTALGCWATAAFGWRWPAYVLGALAIWQAIDLIRVLWHGVRTVGQWPSAVQKERETQAHFERIASEVGSFAFDPETVIERLREHEKATKRQIPSYVFLLLRRFDARTLAPSVGQDPSTGLRSNT